MPDQPLPALRLPDGGAWLLPEGARALPAAPLLRPLPGGGAVALLDGVAVPAFDPGGLAGQEGTVWVALPDLRGTVLQLAGTAFLPEAPPAARPLPAAWLTPCPAPAPALQATTAPRPAASPRQARAALAGLALELGGQRLVLPAALVEHIRPWAAAWATPGPAPGAPPGVLGYVLADAAPALLLDVAWAAGGPPSAAPDVAESLVLLHHAGRRLALACDRVAAVAEPGEAFAAFLRGDAARAALALAPLAAAQAPAAPQPRRGLLLCRAAGLDFALPVEEVEAVIPPLPPVPAGDATAAVRGVCAHRGEVLPVLDAGTSLGGPPALASGTAPLLRLAGPRPVALAVEAMAGLRQLPEADCTPVPADAPGLPPGLTAALARLGEGLLPVLRAAALAARSGP